MTNFCAYDYVGMAHEPEVTAATKGAIDRYGTGAGASRLVSGEKQIHLDLEQALAAFSARLRRSSSSPGTQPMSRLSDT